jgi:flagellar biosynthetic protein FlhB
MADSQETKKHSATPKRRRQARDEGLFPRSSELAPALLWLVSLSVLQWNAPRMWGLFSRMLQESFEFRKPLVGRDLLTDLSDRLLLSGWILLPLFIGIMASACMVGFGQAGLRWMPQRLVPDFSRLQLISPWQMRGSSDALKRSFVGMLKLPAVILIIGGGLWNHSNEILLWSNLDLSIALTSAFKLLLDLCWQLALIWALFAALDYGWQWWMFEQQLRMTDTELRDELKESQGNPQIRARRRELYQDRA